jgi:ABC-type glycerol-3-phosphate transport system substrate-binding protein
MILSENLQNTIAFAQGNCALFITGDVMLAIIAQEVQQNQDIFAFPYILTCQVTRSYGATQSGVRHG